MLGVLPGGGAMLSSFASYALEKKLSRTPERFGKGAIAGVAGPESANNMLVVLNLPLIRVKMLTAPYRFLYPAILLFGAIGSYRIGNNTLDLHMTALFGLFRCVLKILDCPPAPLLLVIIGLPVLRKKREEAFQEEG